MLRENRDLLDKISEYLLEKETIYGEEFFNFVYEKYPELRKEKKEDSVEKLVIAPAESTVAIDVDGTTVVEEASDVAKIIDTTDYDSTEETTKKSVLEIEEVEIINSKDDEEIK